jgi:hypothetical protein
MAPNDEEDDPAVYRSGSRNKSDAKAQATSCDGEVGGHKTHTHANGRTGSDETASSSNCAYKDETKSEASVHSNENAIVADEEPNEEDIDEEMGDEDEDEDNTLLTVQPGFNRLLLVLRDERVMRFVKYVSATATGSRWDVCGEYEVGAVEEMDT